MARKSIPQFIPPIEKSLLKRLHTQENWMIERTAENIERFNELLNSIPREYPWEFRSAEAFERIGNTLESEIEIYQHYWRDMLGQIEAFSVMSAWRLAEISRSGVWALRRGDVLCAAIMSRAGLETAASYAWFQSEVRPALEQLAQQKTPGFIKYEENGLIKDLEDKLLKVVFASKRPNAENFYNPVNIVTIIEKISKKVPHQDAIARIYFELCEVAHPNMVGRSIYITEVQPMSGPGHERRILSRNLGPAARDILQHSIAALSWSTGTFSRSCVVLQDSIGKMLHHLEVAAVRPEG